MARKTAKARQQTPSARLPTAPKTYREFMERYPALARAWNSINEAGADGVPLEQIEQLVPLVAGTIGLPSAVACWSWLRDAAGRD